MRSIFKNMNNDVQGLDPLLFEVVRKVSEAIVGVINIDEVLSLILDLLVEDLGYSLSTIYEVDKNRGGLFTRKLNVPKGFIKIASKFIGDNVYNVIFKFNDKESYWIKAYSQKKLQKSHSLYDFALPNYSRSQANIMQKFLGLKMIIGVPIIVKNQVIGVLGVGAKNETISKLQEQVLETFANQISIAIYNAQLFKKVEEQNKQLEKQNKELDVANSRLKKLDQSKSEFISIASHQLRTPLTAIKGYVSMIREHSAGYCDEVAEKYLEKVAVSTDRLVALVNDLLDVSQIERGKMTLEKRQTRVEDLVEDVVEELMPQAKSKGLEIIFHKPSKSLPRILIDAEKVQQVITNLIDNGIKYTPEGKIEVSVKKKNSEIRVIVKDTGIGIVADNMDRLFTKFSRESAATIMDTEGIGLGLFVGRIIIEKHGGENLGRKPGKR